MNKEKIIEIMWKQCVWERSFDGNFNIGCVDETGQRANGQFKGKEKGAKWEFDYCPYCSGKIIEPPKESES